MKIAYQNHEFEVAPAAQNIDVLLDVTDRTNGIANASTYNLSGNISNYERLIVSVWPRTDTTVSDTLFVQSIEVNVADVLADRNYVRPMFPIWTPSTPMEEYVYVKFDTNTSISVRHAGNSSVGRVKIEGVKRVEGIGLKTMTGSNPSYCEMGTIKICWGTAVANFAASTDTSLLSQDSAGVSVSFPGTPYTSAPIVTTSLTDVTNACNESTHISGVSTSGVTLHATRSKQTINNTVAVASTLIHWMAIGPIA